MSIPTLTPASQLSAVALPVTGTHSEVTDTNLPFGIYASGGQLASTDFISGAVDQVAYTYKKLGGDVLDVELTTKQVYSAYEEAVLEYSYILNIHQSKNVMSNLLGNTTGTFDHDGELVDGSVLSSSLDGGNVALKYTRFEYGYARHVGAGMSLAAGVGSNVTFYSASFTTEANKQDYDLQSIISSSAIGSSYLPSIGNNRITIRKVYYKSPRAMWRFYGYYGGLGVVGNLQSYGQFADDSTFQLIPPWQNKAQAGAFEDAFFTRTSHYAYEIRNNKLRIFPPPDTFSTSTMWVEFTAMADAWEETADRKFGADGINNMNSAPFSNLRFENINSIGKQWIRRFALALAKEMLGHIRGKFGGVPLPGGNVTLNSAELLTQSKEEMTTLRDELAKVLDELTYAKLLEADAKQAEDTAKLFDNAPMGLYIG
jgi:hypothetical protein